jgi:hypothetical protein
MQKQSLTYTDKPMRHPSTEILVLCSTDSLIAYVPPSAKFFTPIEVIPNITPANRSTCARMLKAVKITRGVSMLSIYCPPRRRYVHMAIAVMEKVRELGGGVTIRFDDRLLDNETSINDVLGRMQGYVADIDEASNSKSMNVDQQKLVDAIDLNWLEQRVEVLEEIAGSRRRQLPETLSWGSIFDASRDDPLCSGIIVLAGKTTCATMFNSIPVRAPEIFKEGRIYRLRYLDPGPEDDPFCWKAEHYCNVVQEKTPPPVKYPVYPEVDFSKLPPPPAPDECRDFSDGAIYAAGWYPSRSRG